MASIRFTEEPEEMPKGVGILASPDSAPRSKSALMSGPENSDLSWDESKWAQGILDQDCIKASQDKLDHRVKNFLAVATVEEQESLSESRNEFQRLVTDAVDASKQRDPEAIAAGPSVAERLKHGLSAANAVAYEYVKILDVMVGQAPEYVGLAYGAIKILLVAQVNNEEVKERVKGYLDQIQLKFQIIDHLTAYMPSSQLVTLIAQVYGLFYVFVAKAIKHYTQPRLKRYLRAFAMPWKRFQGIVDSIELKLVSIKDVAQYVGLLEGHTTMMVSQQTLALLQRNIEKNQETKELVEDMCLRLDAVVLKFSKAEGVRQTADSLGILAEERLSEPNMADVDNSVAHDSDIATHLSSTERIEDFDSWQNTLFPELRESSEKASRQQRANEELPNMREDRSKRKSFEKSEIAMAWAESRKSEILWINGNEVLSREDFNASFVCPLMLVGESHFDTVIKLQHFCEERSSGTDSYVIMMQDLVAQVLRQHSSISSQQRAAITRQRTSTTEGLWDLLLELISGTDTSCTFLLIGGIDHIVTRSSQPGEMRAEIVHRFRALMTDAHKVMKIMIAMGLFQSSTTSNENMSSLVRARHPQDQGRRLSLDALQRSFPGQLMSRNFTDIREGRCRNVTFTEIPVLYTPGTMVYTHDNERLTAFVVSEMSGMEPRPFGSSAPLRLRVWSIDHDGQQICKRYQEFAISHFVGRRDISSLALIPSGYLPEELTKRKQIISRGQKYWYYMSGVHYVQIPSQNGHEHGVIDQSARPIDPSLLEGLEPFKVAQDAVIKSRFLMLAPADIYVYSVRGLTWSCVNLEELEPMEFPRNSLKRLILPDKKKDLLVKAIEAVQARPQHHEVASAASKMDPHSKITNRLFLLFHGAQGTGKSFAAQCFANHARRPLFLVTRGMQADEAKFIDSLRTVFKLAKRWDCLIVLDHVDTVVENRGAGDLERNAILTEVLDLIYNYQSILIATTNRVGVINQGLISRTDLAVGFTLTEETRRQIWINEINEYTGWPGSTRYHSTHLAQYEISLLAEHPLDGHTITSIIRSASRIAQTEHREFDFVDLDKYVQEKNELSKYLLELHGRVDQGVARAPKSRRGSADDTESTEGEDEENDASQ